MNIRLGHDGEFMLSDSAGSIIPVVGLLGGTKRRPLFFKELGGAVQEDNVNAEIGIYPTNDEDLWVARTKRMINKVADITKLTPTFKPSHYFQEGQLNNKQAATAGCGRDYDAYTGKMNPKPHLENSGLRSAGGHIHFELPSGVPARRVVRAADLLISVPLVLMDEDTNRRGIYGKAGAYRNKEYGVEYRTPSCFWMDDESTMRWVFKQAQRAVHFDIDHFSVSQGDIIRSINSSDAAMAQEIWDEVA